MQSLIQFKRTTLLFLISLALSLFGFSSRMQAVSPTPDGCYSNFTTAEGCDALKLLTTGLGDTAVGWRALSSNSSGNFNTAIGVGALALNNADSNTAVGAVALLSNTTGIQNTAVGTRALFTNTDAIDNTAIGYDALQNNIAEGNTAVGDEALLHNTTGSGNTGIGAGVLSANTSGTENIALGDGAGGFLTTGSNNIEIGNIGAASDSNTIRIGNSSVQTATFIAGISGQVSSGGVAVFVDGNGKLGTNTSSARFKDQIKPMDNVSEAILALKPVTFRYKRELDPQRIPQFGLVAEQVEKVNPDLVARDKEGKAYTVRYEAVNAMLLNEFLKEHQTVQELRSNVAKQETTIARQQNQIDALTAGLEKVSAQLEVSKPAPKTVLNSQ